MNVVELVQEHVIDLIEKRQETRCRFDNGVKQAVFGFLLVDSLADLVILKQTKMHRVASFSKIDFYLPFCGFLLSWSVLLSD